MNPIDCKNCSLGIPSTSGFNFSFSITPLYRCLKNEGNLVWEYNPLRNYRLSTDKVATNSLDQVLDVNGNTIYSEITGSELTSISYKNLSYYGVLSNTRASTTNQAMELTDFTTERLNFDLNHPVQIECQPSYDGSVNLILNDDKNPPRLINTRFTPMENNTYKIVNRMGNNDANIYDDDQFEIDTSLYKRISMLPRIVFDGIEDGGACKVGNYVFYFRYEDTDTNMTDFVGETGIVTCHIGGVNDIGSIKGGVKDENSNKLIKFTLSNVDSGYSSVRVYYTRYTSDIDGIQVHKNYLIDHKFPIINTQCSITITGYEATSEISDNELNVQYNLIESAKTAAQCQNMLFMGNVNKVDIPYEDLINLSLRVYPIPFAVDSIGNVTHEYSDTTNQFEYYNVKNIYNKLGYWDEEIYRLGIVYIMPDFSLSPVFNIRGRDKLPVRTKIDSSISGLYTNIPTLSRNYDSDGNPIINKIVIDSGDYTILDSYGNKSSYPLENAKGVIRISSSGITQIQGSDNSGTLHSTPIGLRIAFDRDALKILKTKVKGFFIVRQKRIPTILAQGITIGLDKNAYIPLLYTDYSKIDNTKCDTGGGRWIAERFMDDERKIVHDFKKRLYNYPKDTKAIHNKALICPEAELKQTFFNQLFTGGKFAIRETKYQPADRKLNVDLTNIRHYYVDTYISHTPETEYVYSECKLTMVNDDCPMITSGSQKYIGRAGNAEEAWRVRYLLKDDINTEAANLVRGSFGTYVGIEGFSDEFAKIVNIHIPGYDISKVNDYFKIRYEDKSAYMPITDRIDINSIISDSEGCGVNAYRGDCYICNFSHRMVRNFQDPEAPNNDIIVNEDTWIDHYDVSNKEKNEKINRGDINAVQIGHWITFKCCANINLSMRTTDDSHYEENGLTGLSRGFYPLYSQSVTGESKIPESFVINSGNSITLGNKFNFLMADVPYLKDIFATRIMYSNIFINDSYRNGYRVYNLTHYRDYSTIYGGITKLIEFNGVIIAVFEHGVAVIPVNERALAGEGAGGEVFINTSNVLPENPKMLNSNFGSQWIESVVVTPNYVYGVDTTARKIWRTNGSTFEVISDFRVQQFLNRNITLKERESTPVIGIRNVKTHYNAYKQDLMFTFYDNLYGFEECAWNLCFNELLGKWITFYSWIPSYSANIDNIFFSFDRDSSKIYSKLGIGTTGNPSADGITLDNPLNGGGILSLSNRYLPNADGISTNVSFTLEKDQRGFYRYFSINGNRLIYKGGLPENTIVAYLNIKANISFNYNSTDQNMAQYVAGWRDQMEANAGYYSNSIAVVINNNYEKITTDFWKHGQSGIIDIKDRLKPCFWYGKQHPFEFEIIVAENPQLHKIFNNLYIIANKAKPESFHYEIVGEVYDFANDKKNMYYRQEATKELYQNLGSDILYNRDYQETPIALNTKSTLFPLYYERIDTFDEIYDSYQKATSKYNRDYQNHTGSEIVHEPLLDEYRIVTHQKANDIKEVGRLKGNMHYKEDLWNVEIRPINFVQRNENWTTVPPIILNNIPRITATKIVEKDLPTNYDITDIENTSNDELVYTGWTDRKETRIRDKYCKIKVRYSGEDLAIITALKTIYTVSYA